MKENNDLNEKALDEMIDKMKKLSDSGVKLALNPTIASYSVCSLKVKK